ncbi:unnamed protein product [Phytophthora lilii]|uniref:Unnamed protein product n=1 Tax=Phytophthora lilii TaxID=2077276 RepID=A0A9W6WS69_9STRA|nr:unnamed protein product [Phytophthora lilii]
MEADPANIPPMKLSPIDIRMLRFGLRMLLVFPHPTSGATQYDLSRLQGSFWQLLHQDFPFFLDAVRFQSEETSEMWIQRRCARDNILNKQVIEIDEDPKPDTLENVLQTTSIEFIPARSSPQLLAVKCCMLVDDTLVIGVNADHCVLDAQGLAFFMKRWSQHYLNVEGSPFGSIRHDRAQLILRGHDEPTMPHPEYMCRCHPSTQAPHQAVPKTSDVATSQQRLHLSPTKLQKLKAFAALGNKNPPFSTLDCVTALLTWMVTRSREHSEAVRVTTAVNIRRRLQPPLPDNFTGNAVLPALSNHPAQDFQSESSCPSALILHSIAQRIRRSIAKFDDAYIGDTISLLSAHPDPSTLEPAVHFLSGPDVFFSSWRGIGFGDIDFGSKPSYAGPPRLDPCDGVVIFLDEVGHNPGVDAIVFLECHAMAKLKMLWNQWLAQANPSTLRWRAVQGKQPEAEAFDIADEEEIHKKLDRYVARDDEKSRLLLPEAPQLTLEWRDLALRVPIANEPGATEKVILHDANGVAKPGELLAIMGPSGAGKSSLLDCLSGRNANAEGSIVVNGVAGWTPKLRKLVAYAMQDELFHATLTVREHLVFQARLRLGGQVSKKRCLDRANAVMEELGLTGCRDTLIGGWMLRGISGGERKRLAFASEILTNPAVLFVDEPTSGLDSCMARAVVEQLKQLAAKRTVVTAIHQPSSEVYALFDRLYLLAEGATVFEGPACEAITHFAALGLPCPQFMNPADHFMEQLVVLERATDHEGLARQVPAGGDTVDVVVYEVEGRSEDDLEYDYQDTHLPPWGQVEVLAHRNALRLARDPMAFRLQVLQTLIFAFLLGLIYFQLQVDQKGIRNFSGAFFYIVTDQVYSASMPAIISVPVELPIVYRELDVGLYRIGSWFLAKNFCELPSQLALPTLNLVPIYVLIFGVFGSPGFLVFMQMLVLLVAMNSSCVAFGYAVSCICRRVDIAPIVGNIVIMPLLLLGGMFVDPEQVPAMFRWMELVTPFKYGYFGFMRAFWRNVANVPCDLEDSTTDCSSMTGHDVLEGYNIPDQSVWGDVWSLTQPDGHKPNGDRDSHHPPASQEHDNAEPELPSTTKARTSKIRKGEDMSPAPIDRREHGEQGGHPISEGVNSESNELTENDEPFGDEKNDQPASGSNLGDNNLGGHFFGRSEHEDTPGYRDNRDQAHANGQPQQPKGDTPSRSHRGSDSVDDEFAQPANAGSDGQPPRVSGEGGTNNKRGSTAGGKLDNRNPSQGGSSSLSPVHDVGAGNSKIPPTNGKLVVLDGGRPDDGYVVLRGVHRTNAYSLCVPPSSLHTTVADDDPDTAQLRSTKLFTSVAKVQLSVIVATVAVAVLGLTNTAYAFNDHAYEQTGALIARRQRFLRAVDTSSFDDDSSLRKGSLGEVREEGAPVARGSLAAHSPPLADAGKPPCGHHKQKSGDKLKDGDQPKHDNKPDGPHPSPNKEDHHHHNGSAAGLRHDHAGHHPPPPSSAPHNNDKGTGKHPDHGDGKISDKGKPDYQHNPGDVGYDGKPHMDSSSAVAYHGGNYHGSTAAHVPPSGKTVAHNAPKGDNLHHTPMTNAGSADAYLTKMPAGK